MNGTFTEEHRAYVRWRRRLDADHEHCPKGIPGCVLSISQTIVGVHVVPVITSVAESTLNRWATLQRNSSEYEVAHMTSKIGHGPH